MSVARFSKRHWNGKGEMKIALCVTRWDTYYWPISVLHHILVQQLKCIFDPTTDSFNIKIPLLWRVSLLVSTLWINIIRTTSNKEKVLTWNFLLSGPFSDWEKPGIVSTLSDYQPPPNCHCFCRLSRVDYLRKSEVSFLSISRTMLVRVIRTTRMQE